jgi:glyoxylase-like metal-dependent hydrolase (beta-lactamase superfamily II)
VFVGPGGAIGWLASSDGIVVVDSQFPATADACAAALRARSAAPFAALINTHHHGDHVAGNVSLRPLVRQIVQHERCAAAHRAAAQAAASPETARRGLADVTFGDRWTTTIGDERVTAVHLGAAHTGGDALVHFEHAHVVHAGDLVFNGIPPFIDRPSGGSIVNWIPVLDTLMQRYAGAQFIFGHGKDDALTGTVKEVARFRDYLTAALDHVRKGIAAGRPLAEIAGVSALPGFEEYADLVKNYASPIPLFTLSHVLTVAYEELSGL